MCHLYQARCEGMEDTEYRKLALQRFLVFKTLAYHHLGSILRYVDVY
jgi:hypothetical protein